MKKKVLSDEKKQLFVVDARCGKGPTGIACEAFVALKGLMNFQYMFNSKILTTWPGLPRMCRAVRGDATVFGLLVTL